MTIFNLVPREHSFSHSQGLADHSEGFAHFFVMD